MYRSYFVLFLEY